MRLFSQQGQPLVDVEQKLWREGRTLVMRGKIMGAYSMNIYLTPREAIRGLGLLSVSVLMYLPIFLARGIFSSRAGVPSPLEGLGLPPAGPHPKTTNKPRPKMSDSVG